MEKFYGKNLKYIQPEDMQTRDECLYVMRTLDSDIARIDGELTEAKMMAAAKREYSDPRWYRERTCILKSLKRARNSAQERLGDLTRRIRQAKSVEHDRFFVQAAREVLDRETFLMIGSMANAEANKMEEA